MTNDFTQDLIQALKKEGKFFVIAIFDKDMLDVHTLNNLDEMPNQTFTYPDGGTETVREAIVKGIKFALTDEN
jgi:TolB-like protein